MKVIPHNTMTISEAHTLLNEWVSNVNLRKHMWGVGVAMRWYAVFFGEDEAEQERWEVVGLLHDMDWEKYPDWRNGGHPLPAVAFLQERGLDEESCQAILGHATYTNTPRTTRMAKTLFACDELSGFIVAIALIKPDKKLSSVDVPAVVKRLKEKRFAAAINRDEIIAGADELGVPLEEHIAHVLSALQANAEALGL